MELVADLISGPSTGGPPGAAADLATAVEGLTALLRKLPLLPVMSLTAASTLRRLDRDGPQRLSDLAARERVTQPAMTQLVTRLERDGLAERRADPYDARVVLVRITAGGSAVLRERRTARTAQLDALITTLPEADRERILAATPALLRLAAATPPGA
jgi:DNA-binding MarR family transcriptional regulator